MIFRNVNKRSVFHINMEDIREGMTIEETINKCVAENNPIENIVPIIYTARKDGVKPEYDIRTDRWALAQNAMNYVAQDIQTKRENKIAESTNNNSDNSIVE